MITCFHKNLEVQNYNVHHEPETLFSKTELILPPCKKGRDSHHSCEKVPQEQKQQFQLSSKLSTKHCHCNTSTIKHSFWWSIIALIPVTYQILSFHLDWCQTLDTCWLTSFLQKKGQKSHNLELISWSSVSAMKSYTWKMTKPAYDHILGSFARMFWIFKQTMNKWRTSSWNTWMSWSLPLSMGHGGANSHGTIFYTQN